MEQKNPKERQSTNFEKIESIDALNLMKADINYFRDAIVKMKNVDNFDHIIPSGLREFAHFFFSYHDIMYKDQEDPSKLYSVFLDWLDKKDKDFK